MNLKSLACILIGGGSGGAAAWLYAKKRRRSAWRIGDSLSDVVGAHADFLLRSYPAHHQKFQRLLHSDPGADPEPHDEPGTGGVDFICRRGADEVFVVEVTSLRSEAVAKHSRIPVTANEGDGGAFQMTTRQLFYTVRDKADQLADYHCPRVLAITSVHFASSFLLGAQGAEYLLTSEPTITYSLGTPGTSPTLTTNLRTSVFFAPGESGEIVPRRRSVSGILLIGLFDDQCNVIGLLHPEPVHPLNIERFREVPFLQLATWPIVNSIRTEWVVSSPESKIFPHAAIRFPNSEF
jgi:hypothetical protein